MPLRPLFLVALTTLLACVDKPDVTDTGEPIVSSPDDDGDGYTIEDGDCDDGNSTISPSAVELCDSIDNDCDGEVDEGVTTTFYADTDADGFGDDTAPTEACSTPTGYVLIGNDCDDTDASTYPGAPEVCDGADNNCDTQTDEGVTDTFYADADADTYGDPDASTEACTQPSGYTDNADDCDDTDAAISPDGAEVCDEQDNDCDTLIDDADDSIDASTQTTWYADLDFDGFGDRDTTTLSCAQSTGYLTDDNDCDDAEGSVYPGAAEVCDGIYNDCEDPSYSASSAPDDELDDDGDRYVECAYDSGTWAGSSLIRDGDDCDDSAEMVYPGAAEQCDGIYNDCDDSSYTSSGAPDNELDGDGDGYVECAYDSSTWAGDSVSGGDDCDDTDATTYTGASELCDGTYNDCDDPDYSSSGAPDDESDLDGDGYVECVYDSSSWDGGSVTGGSDCDDSEDTVYPGAAEQCDGIYNDCDDSSYTSSGAPDDESDLDGDGYVECEHDSTAWLGGSISGGDDCDDSAETVYPGGEEVCDGLYNDCDDSSYSSSSAPDDESDLDGDGYVECAYSSGSWDGDSVSGGDDCDDDDPDSYPGASELCDGVYNDCDDSSYTSGGAPDAESDLDGDGYIACEYDSTAWRGDSVDGGDDCDDDDGTAYPGGEEVCDGIDNDCNDEIDDGTALGSDASCPAYSCLEIIEEDSSAADGTYYIDPDDDGTETEVYCDMTTDSGGYTYYPVDYGSSTYAATAETTCDDEGMQLLVPRTEDHQLASVDYARALTSSTSTHVPYMYILGIYPTSTGKTCSRVALNSVSCTNWQASDGGPYYVGANTGITEPNGDNSTYGSMYYAWNTSDDSVSWYNDISGNGYGSQYFICDVGDKWGDGVDRGD